MYRIWLLLGVVAILIPFGVQGKELTEVFGPEDVSGFLVGATRVESPFADTVAYKQPGKQYTFEGLEVREVICILKGEPIEGVVPELIALQAVMGATPDLVTEVLHETYGVPSIEVLPETMWVSGKKLIHYNAESHSVFLWDFISFLRIMFEEARRAVALQNGTRISFVSPPEWGQIMDVTRLNDRHYLVRWRRHVVLFDSVGEALHIISSDQKELDLLWGDE